MLENGGREVSDILGDENPAALCISEVHKVIVTFKKKATVIGSTLI